MFVVPRATDIVMRIMGTLHSRVWCIVRFIFLKLSMLNCKKYQIAITVTHYHQLNQYVFNITIFVCA